jgi:hypothetical protein
LSLFLSLLERNFFKFSPKTFPRQNTQVIIILFIVLIYFLPFAKKWCGATFRLTVEAVFRRSAFFHFSGKAMTFI